MARLANLAEGIRRSGVHLGPLDAVFGGLDYYDGKQTGEDDIRAGAGAVGSTLGGWGGAATGAMAGAAIGSAVPIIGTAIGGAVGAIAGGSAGGFAGGYTADRADELIRGNKGVKQMQYYDRNGNLIGEDNQPEPDGVHNALNFGAGATALGVGGMAVNNLRKTGVNPAATYQVARGLGSTRPTAAMGAGKVFAQNAGEALTKLPGWGKVLGAGALLYGTDQALGRPVEKMVDSVTGQATNLDNDPVNRNNSQQIRQMQTNANMQRQQSQLTGQLTYDQLKNDGTLRYMDEQARRDRQEAESLNNRTFYRDTLEARRNAAYSTRAQSARDLLAGYMSSIPNAVAMSVQNVTNARF